MTGKVVVAAPKGRHTHNRIITDYLVAHARYGWAYPFIGVATSHAPCPSLNHCWSTVDGE